MNPIIDTALLYIRTFLGVEASTLPADTSNISNISEFFPYLSQSEQQAIAQLLQQLSDREILMIKDSLQAHYALTLVAETHIIIGPFRAKDFSSQNLPTELAKKTEEYRHYLKYIQGVPMLDNDQLIQVISLLFFSLSGDAEHHGIREVDLKKYSRFHVPQVAAHSERSRPEFTATTQDDSMVFITSIRNGNSQGALDSYHHSLNRRVGSRSKPQARSFPLILEGLSNIRVQAGIALHLAGLPDSIIDPVLLEYRIKARDIHLVRDAISLGEKLIIDSCNLVIQFKCLSYSPNIRAAISYIHRNLAHTITIQELATEACLSPNRLSTKFHQEVGMTPMAYLRKQRLQSAAELLKNTQMNIQSISACVGIMDANYFARCFRSAYGMTPTAYRNAEYVSAKQTLLNPYMQESC